MLVRRCYDDRLAQASYLIGCQATGEAIVIDPARDVTPYLDAARQERVRITRVTETHIHADFLSGSRRAGGGDRRRDNAFRRRWRGLAVPIPRNRSP